MKENTKKLSKRVSLIILEKDKYKFYINNPQRNHQELKFSSNTIDTRKYNIFTFLPKALFYQFVRLANVYFLICAVLQCIPMISPLNPLTAVLPLIIVLSASLIREGMEDCARGTLDNQQNNEICEKYNPIKNEWEQTRSGDLYVGDIICVKENDTFPADIILLDSNLPEGICYVETGTLDGEKTLKLKEASKLTGGWYNNSGIKISKFILEGKVFADMPNPELYKLNGKMNLKYYNDNINNNDISNNNNEQLKQCDVPLDSKQLLLKGAKLKNTLWVMGIVVYSGSNCKIMKNAKEPVTKYSSVEKLMNQALIYIFIFQGILCLISALLRGYYYHKNKLKLADKNKPNFGYTMYSFSIENFFNYFTYLLLLNTLIPISLIITIEVVKLFQGYFMQKDQYSYSKIRKKFLNVNSVSLNEECGMVNYIFSDKTGTLTCNKMEFKYCVIGEICYQFIRNIKDETDEKEIKFRNKENIIPYKKYDMYDNFTKNKNNLNFSAFGNNNKVVISSEKDPNIKIEINSTKDLIEQYFYALALCHTCSIQLDENNKEEYACVSPDSIELVKAASNQGWKLIESGSNTIKRIKLGNDEDENNIKDFQRLELIEFNSDRKRETVIVKEINRNNDTNTDNVVIKLYCKGADSIIEERLSNKTPKNILEQCKYYVNKFSSIGYRTLFIAMKILSQEEYDKFSSDLKEAQMSLENKEQKVKEVYDTIENNLILLGATIVEDKLQDLVPETIRDLRLAKVKVWMLTGDKMNTAYNIGLSCNLISTKMKTFNIRGLSKKVNTDLKDINLEERNQVILDFAKEFQGFKNNFDSMAKPSFGILVDEKALLTISEDEEIQKIFLEIAKDAESVICCRVSPLQKSQVVKMMKNFDTQGITLSIGDGGNDVPMIMEAHIGVGIYGEEGLRAVQSSDYAIGEFKFLRELLFSHGRINYMRNTECIHYFFFKNFVETFNHFIYGFYNNFTGQTIIDDWFITLYNLLFTSLPLGTKAILDIDICRDDGEIVYKMLPFIYKENRDNPKFTIGKFFLNLLKGLIYSLINSFCVIYSIYHIQINKKGQMAGLWFMSVDIYTNILIIVTVTLLITTKYHTWIHFIILFIVTFLAYICFIFIVQNLTIFNSVGTMNVAFSSPVMWLNIFLICGFSGLIEFFILAFNYTFRTNTVTTLQKLFKEKGKLNSEEGLPLSIKQKIDLYNGLDENKKDDIIINKKEKELNNINLAEDDINNNNKINTKKEDINIDINKNMENNNERKDDENSQDLLIQKKYFDNKYNKSNDNDKDIDNNKDNDKDKKTDIDKNDDDVHILKQIPEDNNKNKNEIEINNNNISEEKKTNKDNDEKKTNKEDEEDNGENYDDEFSERISKEGNLVLSSGAYFKDSTNIKNKFTKNTNTNNSESK